MSAVELWRRGSRASEVSEESGSGAGSVESTVPLWPLFRPSFVVPRWAWSVHIPEDEAEDWDCSVANPCSTCCHNPECPTHVNCDHCENISEDCSCDYCTTDYSVEWTDP